MTPLEQLRQEAFSLTYLMNGMTFTDVEGMLGSDRVWFIERLSKQLSEEKRHHDDVVARARRR